MQPPRRPRTQPRHCASSRPELRAKATDHAVNGTNNLRSLAARNPTYRKTHAEWAASPTTTFLANTGQYDKAQTLGEEAIDLYKKLAAENPADDELAFRISWASMVLANSLWGKPELRARATEYAVNGVNDLRSLAARNASYRPQLAEWIMWPTIPFLVETGQKARALPLAQEDVDLYTRLNAQDPAAYGAKLAAAKKTLADL
ncbi:hypothetical protein GCM10010218_30320 [Streptomyces mashuensis]|uniref:Tetratricopeptide repeat protein n=1 Tax=Streptomyces mashuensis TaxID=33904 RepID=A0A919B4W0_9ACTN|nr:hypothetical protein [Streptomyces mashuensis]GHF46967.1 hypothetical protein GCM10010218_30320 [Streptomyces mashuensis]